MNSRSVGIFAVVVAILVGVAVWFLNSEYAPHAPQKEEATPTPKATAQAPEARTEPAVAPTRPAPYPTAPVVVESKPPAPVEMTEDDRKIDGALKMFPGDTDQDHANTAQALINLLPTLTPDGQVEAAQHISNLIDDKDYGKLMPIWRNPTYNPDVLEVFATDLMNREHKVMLPAMLDAIRLPNHPFHDEAKSNMEIFLDHDYGNDVAAWEKAMKEYLKKEAEEEAQ